MPRRLVAVVFIVFVSYAGFAQRVDESTVSVSNARDAALGGSHIALPSGFQTMFSNPAGLIDVEPQFSVSELTFRFTGPVFSLSSVIIQGVGGDFAALLGNSSVQSLLSSIYANLSLTGPLYFGYAGAGLGFVVLNDSEILFRNVGATSIEARLSERFLLSAGYGLGIPLPESSQSSLSLGFGLKGFVRGDVIVSTSLLALPTLVDSIGPDLLTDSPFELISGIGIDAGISYWWRDVLGVALTADNLYTPTAVLSYDTLSGFLDSSFDPGEPTYATMAQNITLGLAYTPHLGGFERYVQDLALMLDYRDIFDFWLDPANAENIILKFGVGLEATLLNVLSIRAGFSEGLLAAGLGIDMSIVQLGLAMYGTELSIEPGLRPVYNLIFGLEFRL